MFRKKRVSAAPAAQPRVPEPPVSVAETQPEKLNGLTLAYIGDAVYELMARETILAREAGNVNRLHEKTVSFSNAAFQSYVSKALEPLLTEEEAAAFRRGRNARPGHVPKNKTQAQYHRATGLEALFGYLYLTRQTARIAELFGAVVKINEEYEHAKRTEEQNA